MNNVQPRVGLSPEQALSNLDQAIAQISANRDTHVVLQNCIEVLRNTVVDWRKFKVTPDKESGEEPKEKSAKKK